MKKIIFLMMIFSCILFSWANLEASDANDILKKLDENKSIGSQFAFEMELTAFISGQMVDQYTLVGYVTIESKKSKTLVYFTSPSQVRGRKMLMIDNDIWMHFPQTKNVIRLSPMQVLLGEASNGDIARVNYSFDYAAEILSNDNNGEDSMKLLLTAKNTARGKTYSKIILVVNKTDYRPIYGEFYVQSGKLLKTVYYKDYQKILGKDVAMTTEIHDSIHSNDYTSMKYKKIVLKTMADYNYRKEFLPRFELIPLE